MSNQALIINGESVELSSDTKIVITYQSNDLADLKDRQASFTNQFRCPDTDENKRIFENVNDPHSGSVLPYRNNTATIVASGVEVLSYGSAVIDKTQGDFSVTVYDALKKFFDLVGDKKISDIDFSDLVLVWGCDDISAKYGNLSFEYVYSIINNGLNLNKNTRTIQVDSLAPSIFVKAIFDRMFAAIGYRYESESFGAGSDFLSMIIPFTNEKIEVRNEIGLKGHLSYQAVIDTPDYHLLLVPNQTAPYFVAFNDISVNGWNFVGTAFNVVQGKLTSPIAQKGLFYFRAYLEVIPDDLFGQIWHDINIGLVFVVNGSVNQTYIRLLKPYQDDSITVGGRTFILFEHTFEYTASIGDQIRFGFLGGNSTAAPNLNDFRLVNENPVTGEANFARFGALWEYEAFNGIWNVAKNLPDIKQKDLIKAIANKYCQILIADNVEKVLRFIPFNVLKENIPDADERFDVVVEDEKQVETILHATDYARQNFFRWKKDDTVPAEYGDSFFAIDDETLSEKKTIVEMPFAASDRGTFMKGRQFSNVIKFLNNDSSQIVKPVARLLYVNKVELDDILVNGHVLLTYPVEGFSQTSRFLVASYFFVDGDETRDLRFDSILPDDYSTIISALNRYRRIRPKMILPASVMADVKPFHPKYIKRMNGYFYLNKVENWRENEPVVVELIKIN
jgi:hypothetical protein